LGLGEYHIRQIGKVKQKLETMKTLLWFFGILAITFGVISIYFIGFSFFTTIQTDGSSNFHDTATEIYEALSRRAGLYSFSFVILAFWVDIPD